MDRELYEQECKSYAMVLLAFYEKRAGVDRVSFSGLSATELADYMLFARVKGRVTIDLLYRIVIEARDDGARGLRISRQGDITAIYDLQ